MTDKFVSRILLPWEHPHIIRKNGGWGLSDELASWLNAIEDHPKFEGEDIRVWCDGRNSSMEFMFRKAEVAMMFKLAWVGAGL